MAGESSDASYASAEMNIDQIYQRVDEVLAAWEAIGRGGAQATTELSATMLLA